MENLRIRLARVLGLVSVLARGQDAARWELVPRPISGILAAFVVRGAWTIGLYLAPSFLCFLFVGLLLTQGQGARLLRGLALLVTAALLQALIMLAAVQFV